MRHTIRFLSPFLFLALGACADDSLAQPVTPSVDMALAADAAQPLRPDAALPKNDCQAVTIGPWVLIGDPLIYRANASDPKPFPGTTTFTLVVDAPQVGTYSKTTLTAYRTPAPPEPGFTGTGIAYVASYDDAPLGNMDAALLADDSGHCLELPESFF